MTMYTGTEDLREFWFEQRTFLAYRINSTKDVL